MCLLQRHAVQVDPRLGLQLAAFHPGVGLAVHPDGLRVKVFADAGGKVVGQGGVGAFFPDAEGGDAVGFRFRLRLFHGLGGGLRLALGMEGGRLFCDPVPERLFVRGELARAFRHPAPSGARA